MKKSNSFTLRILSRYILLFIFSISLLACNNNASEIKTETKKEEAPKATEILWQINAIHPDGKTMAIKAIDKEGNQYDVKAIQDSDQHSFLDIKAIVGEKKLPIKMLVSEDQFAPVKAIDRGGISYDIKAITEDGEKLDVKGITQFGTVVSLKAINKKGKFYGVKAISPTGELNDVQGIKINVKEKEMTLNGFNVFAHIKAMHQSSNKLVEAPKKPKKKGKKKKKIEEKKSIIWNIKAVTLEGENLDVKAIDTLGNKFDLKAIQDSDQYSFMNIKALVDGDELPVKVLVSEDTYSPVKAISRNGNVYDIKAISSDGTIIDIKGIGRSGGIVDIKAITESGEFYGIKAFSPDGKLNDVKGIKIFDREKEMNIRGNKVFAHVKAITQ